MRDWDEEEIREAGATMLELAARLVRLGREKEDDPTCCVEPPLALLHTLTDLSRAVNRGSFWGAVRAAGFDPEEEVAGVERRAARLRALRSAG